ncbi:hypothetical protein PILCRDRAFT_821388 [Piloderma croceum F 1598]|uniref:Uncharacterized protein n=1 Tax=Piloderma croceum (strain F 1598) TaxID=765440 RepID=A0A0C3FPJ6_PILCF|nr:hypothetical protein PILCRDRAFT_821388 [Piloderma croceum F 1598]
MSTASPISLAAVFARPMHSKFGPLKVLALPQHGRRDFWKKVCSRVQVVAMTGRIGLSNDTIEPPLRRGITMSQVAQFAKIKCWVDTAQLCYSEVHGYTSYI